MDVRNLSLKGEKKNKNALMIDIGMGGQKVRVLPTNAK
jgi:hypothetical protein